MQVYKLFLKILNKHKGLMLMYVGIYLGITMIVSGQAKDNADKGFENSYCNFAVFDADESQLSKELVDYLKEENKRVTIKDDSKECIQDELYARNIACAIHIPDGFEEAVKKGEGAQLLQFDVIPGTTVASSMKAQVNGYLKVVNTYMQTGFSVEEAAEKALKAMDVETVVTKLDTKKTSAHSSEYYFFLYCVYVFIAMAIIGIGPILLVFDKKELKDRINCSSYRFSAFNKELLMGMITAGGIICLLFLLMAVATGAVRVTVKSFLYVGNMLCVMVVALTITYLVTRFVKKSQMLDMAANVIGLGTSFLCGVFVPMEFLGEGVLRIARFLPGYWYVLACNAIDTYTGSADLIVVGKYVGIQLLYAAAFVSIGLVITRYKAKNR